MKKIILSAVAIAAIGFAAFATGVIGPNPPQAGTSTFSASTGLLVTNTFPYVYTTVPIVQLAGVSTNNGPFTATSVTVSNFVLTVTTASTTNNTVAWNSYAGYPRIQYGSQAVLAATVPTNVTFSTPYAYAPVVTIAPSALGAATNSIPVVTAITTTNFTLTSGANQTVNWHAIGTAYTPGANTVTY